MDRTDELLRSAAVYGYLGASKSWNNLDLTPYSRIALRACTVLDSNEELVQRIESLTERKEFSNDPTVEISELTGRFQKCSSGIQVDLSQLKQHTEGASLSTHRQQQQHYKIVLEHLQKRLSVQVNKFKNSLRTHGDNVKARTERVTSKYGFGNEQLRAGSSALAAGTNSYAMFSIGNEAELVPPPTRSEMRKQGYEADVSFGSGPQELRRRNVDTSANQWQHSKPANNAGGSGSQLSGGGGLVQDLIHQKGSDRTDVRLTSAKKVEASIAQMGQLFSNLATLVMEQSESIARIEDDVEDGLQNVTEAHNSMLTFSEITKGNRGMIIKIFGLLIFFILLFLWWT